MSATGWDCGSVWSQAFSFDAFGNITKSGTTSFQPTYYTATNHFNTLPVGEPSYDANGNLTGDSFHSYGWNAEGLNTEIDSSATSMIYDALGRWVERRNAGTVAAVYGPDGKELAVTIGQTLVGAYVALPAGATALYLSSRQLGNWWHPDWLGTARLYSNPSHVIFIAPTPINTAFQGDRFDLAFATGCSAEGCTLTIDPNGAAIASLQINSPNPGGLASNQFVQTQKNGLTNPCLSSPTTAYGPCIPPNAYDPLLNWLKARNWGKARMYAACVAGVEPSYMTKTGMPQVQDVSNSLPETQGARQVQNGRASTNVYFGMGKGIKSGGQAPINPNGDSPTPGRVADGASYLANVVQCIANGNNNFWVDIQCKTKGQKQTPFVRCCSLCSISFSAR